MRTSSLCSHFTLGPSRTEVINDQSDENVEDQGYEREEVRHTHELPMEMF